MKLKPIQMRVEIRGYLGRCPECKAEFKARRKDAVYCTAACNYKAWSRVHRAPGMRSTTTQPPPRRKA